MANTPKMIVLSEQLRGQTFELSEEVYTIGRGEDQSIPIVDPTVSTRHCELIRNEDGMYTARDLGSTNGTRINGMRIEEQKLINSDILQVGGVELLYDCDDKSPTSVLSTQTQINLQDTMQLNPGLENKNPFGSKKTESRKTKLVFIAVIAVLVVIVGILAVVLLLRVTGPVTP
jgi:pSer/pThr/pTyr-binding forkhead associated (FHA) protein